MAIKDWKKISIPKYPLDKFTIVTIEIFENKESHNLIKINHRKDFEGTPFVVIIDDLNNVTNIATEYFKTKSQAFSFAKNYMREN